MPDRVMPTAKKQTPVVAKAPSPIPVASEMPVWLRWFKDREGWTEFSKDRELSAYWPLVGINYKTVIGTMHAWCGLSMAAALSDNKLPFPKGAAGAVNWETYGEPCPWICGAILPMRHASGGRHVTLFLYWQDEAKKIAACLGGNQGDSIKVSLYNLSGNKNGHDEVPHGPRWPKGVPQVAYAYKKVGRVIASASTR